MSGLQYKVLLIQEFYNDDDMYRVTLCTTIEMPFIPIVGMSIGVKHLSDRRIGFSQITDVAWNHVTQSFHVRLKPNGWNYTLEDLQPMLLSDWRIYDAQPCDDAESAVECAEANDFYAVWLHKEKTYHAFDTATYYSLRYSRKDHTVLCIPSCDNSGYTPPYDVTYGTEKLAELITEPSKRFAIGSPTDDPPAEPADKRAENETILELPELPDCLTVKAITEKDVTRVWIKSTDPRIADCELPHSYFTSYAQLHPIQFRLEVLRATAAHLKLKPTPLQYEI